MTFKEFLVDITNEGKAKSLAALKKQLASLVSKINRLGPDTDRIQSSGSRILNSQLDDLRREIASAEKALATVDAQNEGKAYDKLQARLAQEKKDRDMEFEFISQELAKHDISVKRISGDWVHVHGGKEEVKATDKHLKRLGFSNLKASQAAIEIGSAPSIARSVATYKKGTPWAGD